ncbi:MAG: hypothetical protein ACPGF7_00905 [Pontibacterium sp.]
MVFGGVAFSNKITPIATLFLLGSGFLFFGWLFSWQVLELHITAVFVLYAASFVFFVAAYGSIDNVVVKDRRVDFSLAFDLFVLAVSILAVLSLFYDRFYLRGIDYFSQGMAAARSEINEGSVSGSFFSVFGNFFSYGYLIPLINTLYQWETRSIWNRFLVITGVSFVVLFFSFLMGGRTVLLITIVVVLSCLVGRKTTGHTALPSGIGLLKIFLLFLLVLFLFGFVFYVRANTFLGGDSFLYVENVCTHLTSFLKEGSYSCNIGVSEGGIAEALNYLNAIGLYAFHVLWVSDSVLFFDAKEGSVLLAGIGSLVLSRFGISLPAHDYAGFFVPAGASIVYDLGIIAVPVFFMALGLMLRLSLAFHLAGRPWAGRYGFVFLYSFCILSLIISPANLPGLLLAGMCISLYAVMWSAVKLCLKNGARC